MASQYYMQDGGYNMSSGEDMSYQDVYDTMGTTESPTIPLIKQSVHMIAIYSIAYGLIFIFAVAGNFLVVAVIYKDPSMRNVTNYFILNLAVADLLVAILCVPITLLANLYSGWRFGALMCKSTPYITSVVQCASVNTLAAIAFDRYLAICYSRHSKITSCRSRTTIFFIWVFSASIMIPQAIYFQMYMHPDYPTIPICHQLWPSFNIQRAYFLIALFILCYVVPLIMILLCYVLLGVTVWKRNAPGIEESGKLVVYRSKVKVLKMLAVIVVLFAFSWLPLYTVYLRMYFGDVDEKENKLLMDIIIPIAQWLGSSNCCVNPIIYCFFSKKYRRGFSNILHCRCIRRRRFRSSRSLSTRYVNVENSSCNRDHNHEHTNRIASNKFMVVAFCNGKMTVSFRKENGSDESSF